MNKMRLGGFLLFFGLMMPVERMSAQSTSTSTRDDNRAGIYLGMFPLGVSAEEGLQYSLKIKLFGNSTRSQGGLVYFRDLQGGKLSVNSPNSEAARFGTDTLQFEVSSDGAVELPPLTSDNPLTFGSVTIPTDVIHFDMSDPLNSNVLGVACLEVRDKNDELLSSVLVAMARPAVRFLANAEFTGGGRTWLAVLNPSNASSVKVTLKLGGVFVNSQKGRGDDRSSSQEKTIEIKPGMVMTMYLDEFFGDIATGVFIPARLDIFASDGVVVNTYHVGKQIAAVPVFPRR